MIIGGGITGLTAMYNLQKNIHEKNLPIDTLLIEASGKLGGKIQTVRKFAVLSGEVAVPYTRNPL